MYDCRIAALKRGAEHWGDCVGEPKQEVRALREVQEKPGVTPADVVARSRSERSERWI